MTRRWILACITGVAIAAVMAALAGWLSPVAPALSALVFGLCTLPVGVAAGWLLCVAPARPEPELSDDDVESRWLSAALSGTATDLIVVIGVGLAAVSLTRRDVPADLLLLTLLLFAAASCTVRYALARRKMLSA
ncbi:MAG: hypothetical protein WBQ44_21115 [Rhodococcus sp. (in: high G+C Gram-positive bacteria)]